MMGAGSFRPRGGGWVLATGHRLFYRQRFSLHLTGRPGLSAGSGLSTAPGPATPCRSAAPRLSTVVTLSAAVGLPAPELRAAVNRTRSIGHLVVMSAAGQ